MEPGKPLSHDGKRLPARTSLAAETIRPGAATADCPRSCVPGMFGSLKVKVL